MAEGSDISCGIRVNPEYSEVETELYNPCAPGTRFGITADLLPDALPVSYTHLDVYKRQQYR